MFTRISTYLTPNQKSNIDLDIDLGISTAFLVTTCYYIPALTYPLLGAQAFKLTLHMSLSYLKSKDYIGEQFHKSAMIALDPIWPIIYPICLSSQLTPYFAALIENDVLLKSASNLLSYAPLTVKKPIFYLTSNSALKFSAAFTSGVITPIVYKTLDKICNPLNRDIEKKFNPNSIYLSTNNLILPSVLSIFSTQFTSEYATPYGCFIKGLILHLSMHAVRIAQPNLSNIYSTIKDSMVKGVIYAMAKSIAAALPLPAFLPEAVARLEIYYSNRKALEELLIWSKNTYIEKLRNYITENNFMPTDPRLRTFLSSVDFITATAIVASATYSLCASTYLSPFILSSAAHLGASYILKSAVNNNILSKDAAAIAETAFVSATICMSFAGFSNNITNSVEGNSLSDWLGVKPLVNTILVGGIPTLCFGLIGKTSNYIYGNEDNKDKPATEKVAPEKNSKTPENTEINSILYSTFKEVIAHYPKYYLHLVACEGLLYGAALGGALKYVISYAFADNKPEGYKLNFALGTALAALGAANHTAYQLVNYGNDFTNICISSAIEMFDMIIATGAKNYFCNLVSNQPESQKIKMH
ncbi:hypothetical protein NF27_IN00640 [Candidatus Jidaibacter acanthamoeba]|uniref:Uncharacterized protein n=1 Tax=Candidatus Jidaibacter acanthamoebae TaxID=86105 RepID=A0A0C1QJF7_9RICK|nr:hypothetical protein [Candidatus Jidaibacter acanthamoeba]KIE04323.1 hypothetical protein NF27_IN00640 [Candidatus Jidaibacter acanthamoeba]